MLAFGANEPKKKDEDLLNELKLHRESHLEMIRALSLLGTNLNKIQTQLEKQLDAKTELVTVPESPNSMPFHSDGYRFNSVFVSDSQVTDTTKLVVKVDGLSYTLTLQAGENIVNIPDGSEISVTNTSGGAASLVFSRFNTSKS